MHTLEKCASDYDYMTKWHSRLNGINEEILAERKKEWIEIS